MEETEPVMTTVDHADIRGLATTFLVSVRCLPRSRNEDLNLLTPSRVTPYRGCISSNGRRCLTGVATGGGKKSLGRRARSRRKKREPDRGHDDKDRPALIAWISRQGAVVIHVTKDFTMKTGQKAADLAVQAGSRLYTDSSSS